ncbi:MAG: cytochrome c oxidase assembly factor CtaG [Candidatus Carbobacillus altaicus]|nr:cytochrome c oxidase assembly factor CtaG [Candidatus Carbobacillus altaicus]
MGELYQSLQVFGWYALWNPDKIVLVLILFGLYLLFMVGPLRPNLPFARAARPQEIIATAAALLLYYIVQGSPFYLMSHMIFSLHMTHMAILYLLIPPLLIIGIPGWAYAYLFRYRPLKRLVDALSYPLVAIFLFNGLFSLYHLPTVFDFLNTHRTFHALYAILMFTAGWIMWWPILNPLPDRTEMSHLRKVTYIFANGILLTPACAFLFLSETPLYQTYYDHGLWTQMVGFCLPPGTRDTVDLTALSISQFNLMPPLDDQHLGGILMKIWQELIYAAFLILVLVRWFGETRKKDREIEQMVYAEAEKRLESERASQEKNVSLHGV